MADSGHNNQRHEWYEDLLGAYALDALLPAEKAEFEAYLATSPALQDELRELRLGVQAYALVAEERSPSPELRDKLWSAISVQAASDVVTTPDLDDEGARMDAEGGPASDSGLAFPAESHERDNRGDGINRMTSAPVQPRVLPTATTRQPTSLVDVRAARGWVINPLLGKMAAALVVLLVGSLIAMTFTFNDDNSGDDPLVVGQFALSETADPALAAGGDVQYLEDRNIMLVTMHDLPELSEGEVYQLWVISGDVVAPSVVFERDPTTNTTIAMVADPTNVDALAITREPGPIGSISATTQPFLIAPIETDAG